MRRLFKIILAIILIVLAILLVAWLRARHTAQQQGKATPTFRQFLGLGSVTPTQQQVTPGTGLTSDFTTPTPSTTPDTTGQTTSPSTATSQFTSGPISPTQGAVSIAPSNTTTTTATGAAPDAIAAPTGTVTAPTSAQCSDADLSIQFTPEEITQLNALQNRFYTIAGLLHTDGDVKAEVANHDLFKAKADQITELYNYCVAQAPKITAPLYSSRVSTPFWRDESKDVDGYVYRGNDPNPLTAGNYDPRETGTNSLIERIFKLNLW